jgi:hypothetical protein
MAFANILGGIFSNPSIACLQKHLDMHSLLKVNRISLHKPFRTGNVLEVMCIRVRLSPVFAGKWPADIVIY